LLKCSATQRPASRARELDLAVAVEQHHCDAGRRIVGKRADEAPPRLRGPERILEPRTGDVEHVAVALGECWMVPIADRKRSTASSERRHPPLALSSECDDPHRGAGQRLRPSPPARGVDRICARAPSDPNGYA
jgi:hypothetical protein